MAVKKFWYEGKKESEKRDYQAHLASLKELAILREAINREIASLQKSRLSSEAYSQAAYPYKQAAINGQERALTSVLEWLDFS